jgi:outer membrane cobalamin receptor
MGIQRIPFLLALGATPIWAGNAAAEPPPPKVEASATVTVTAEATPIELKKTPNPVVVIDKAAIEAQGADNLGDLLQKILPGQVFSSGGVGTSTTLSLAGGRPQDTVVTLDGIRLADVTGLGGVNLSFVSLAGIERIEVQQGPCSTRYGSDAQAGVVALYSAGHVKDGFSGQVRAGAGTQGILQGAFAPAYGWGSGWARASLSAQRENGALDADHPYRTTGTFLGVGQQLGEDTLLTVDYLNAFSGVPIPISYADYGTQPRYASQFVPGRQDFSRMEVMSATLRSTFSPTLTGDLTLGQALQTRLEPNYTDNAATEHYESRRNQANGALTWRFHPSSTLQGGFDAYEETAWFAGNPDPASGRHLGLFVEDQTEVTDTFRVVGTVRAERDRLSFPTSSQGSQDKEITRGTWKLGVNWLPASSLRLYASAGTAFANPLLFQAIYNAQYQGETLDNERSLTYQAGASWEQGPWRAGLELSRTAYENLVFYDPNGGQKISSPYGDYFTGIYRNGSELRLQSAQATLGYETAAWGLKGFYRNQEFRDTKASEATRFQAAAVIRKPFQTLGLNGHRTVAGRLRLEATWSWIGSRYDYGLPTAFRQHFNDLGVSAAWSFSKDLVVALRGDHLMQPRTTPAQWLARTRDFENDASQIFGYPAQPPTGTLEVRYRF